MDATNADVINVLTLVACFAFAFWGYSHGRAR